jgi:hypothetical protein
MKGAASKYQSLALHADEKKPGDKAGLKWIQETGVSRGSKETTGNQVNWSMCVF